MLMSISVLSQKGSEEKKTQLGGQNISEASTTQWT